MADVASWSGPCSGWEARGYALRCLLGCIPRPDAQHFDAETFWEIIPHANKALLYFADALFKLMNNGEEADSDPVLLAVLGVCSELWRFEIVPEYGKVAGFPPSQFVEAVHNYLCFRENEGLEGTLERLWSEPALFWKVREQVDAYRCGGDRQQVRTSQSHLLAL